MNDRRSRRGRAGRLVFGLFLSAIGALLLADRLGLDVPGPVWSYWPLLLIALGAVKLAWPGDGDERSGGYWLVVAGVYGWISTRELFGLGWSTAWPIVLVAVGLQMAFESSGRSACRRGGAEVESDERRA